MMGDTGELVTFEAVGCGFTRAKLGAILVGDIYEPTFRGVCVGWRLSLPEQTMTWRPARSVPEAKARLRDAVAQWVDAAGLAPASRRSSEIRAYRQAPHQLARVPT